MCRRMLRTRLPPPRSLFSGSSSRTPHRKQSVTHCGITASERIACPALSLRQKPIASALRPIYHAAHAEAAAAELEVFDQGSWGRKYPAIAQSWRRNWEAVIPFFAFPAEVRKIIYTTNAIESVNSVIRKFTRNRKQYPNEESALKLVYLAIHEASKKWTMPIRNWREALNHFAIIFEDRLPATARS